MKKVLVVVAMIALCFTLAGCGGQAPAKEEAQPKPQEQPKAEEAPEPKEAASLSALEVYGVAAPLFRQNLEDAVYSLDYDEEFFTVTYVAPGSAVEASKNSKLWKDMVSSMEGMGRQAFDHYTPKCSEYLSFTVVILNDTNKDKILYSGVNGKTTINAAVK